MSCTSSYVTFVRRYPKSVRQMIAGTEPITISPVVDTELKQMISTTTFMSVVRKKVWILNLISNFIFWWSVVITINSWATRVPYTLVVWTQLIIQTVKTPEILYVNCLLLMCQQRGMVSGRVHTDWWTEKALNVCTNFKVLSWKGFNVLIKSVDFKAWIYWRTHVCCFCGG